MDSVKERRASSVEGGSSVSFDDAPEPVGGGLGVMAFFSGNCPANEENRTDAIQMSKGR